ncbi:MAG: glycosyltransferase family 39 protein [Ilumatobacteraceae bacterium]|jgi:Gpi18-like mannosyltransferase|nr:glycosyltransferase family 39 protein [Ilumatobacteraceae bacterium]
MEQSSRLSTLVPPASDPWGRAIRRGAVAYVLSRLFAIMGAAIAVAAQAVWARLNEEEPVGGLTGLVQVFDSWDGHWYLDVVREGYPHHIMPNVTYFVSDARAAFFPLYPRLVHYLDNIIPGGPVTVALLVNLVFGAAFIYLVGVIAKNLFDVKTSEKAMMIAAFFPGSFVLSWAYSEALLLTLACLCFIALSKKMWWWAGIFAALGTACRPNGIALVAACAVASLIAIKQDREWKSLIAPILSPIGFVGFMAFLMHHTDENFAWFRVQSQAWKEGTSFGATAVSRTFDFILNPTGSPTSVLTAASMFAMVLALIALWKFRLPAMYTAYTAVVLVLMLLPATVTARPRFLFTAFPLIFPVARALRDDEDKWWPIVLLIFATGLVTVTGMYGVRAAIP